MRRKSARTSGKPTPEKGKQSDVSIKKSRRSSKRRRKSASESDNSDEENTKHLSETRTTPLEGNSDAENNESIIEKESDTPDDTSEKHDKKIKLKRNRWTANSEANEASSEDKYSSRRSRRRGSPKEEERTQDEEEEDDDDDDKKGKGKSKGKTKSKIEKSQPPNESEAHNESEISTNAQVTPQSPHIDNTNVVDVTESTEAKKGMQDYQDDNDENAKNKQELEHEVNNKTEMYEDNSNNDSKIAGESLETEKETIPHTKENKDVNIENNTTEVAITNSPDKTTNEEIVHTETSRSEASVENIRSDEDFAGFTEESAKHKDQAEFVEEPMDISMDATFTLKTDDSSINITETEETNEENTSETITTIEHSKESEVSSKRLVNKKIQLIRKSDVTAVINRKRGWGSRMIMSDLFAINPIDTKTFLNIYGNVELLDESEVKLDLDTKDRRKSFTDGKERTRLERSVSSDSDYKKTDIKSEEKEQEDNANIIAMNRKISIVDDSASKLKPPPSPAKNPLSNVLFITNLVRPFTLKQLRELLERTGTIKENGFWTDRIKSKCYVQYETVEDAEATRNALHGVHWPIGNGKKLIIDYATVADMENAKNPPLTPPIPEIVQINKEIEEPLKKQKEPEIERIKEKSKEKRRHEHIREWDVGKAEGHRGRSRSRDKEKRRHSRHSPSPFEDYIPRKQKKIDDPVPQKLMDDLFQKTKVTPSIYWQPLSPEEIATKQQQRLERMAEHKKRLEESTRNRAEFGRGGPYRRRYD